jgi:hypothetical protein
MFVLCSAFNVNAFKVGFNVDFAKPYAAALGLENGNFDRVARSYEDEANIRFKCREGFACDRSNLARVREFEFVNFTDGVFDFYNCFSGRDYEPTSNGNDNFAGFGTSHFRLSETGSNFFDGDAFANVDGFFNDCRGANGRSRTIENFIGDRFNNEDFIG